MIRYVITTRHKTQTNKKRNNVTEADFEYSWGSYVDPMVFSKSKAAKEAEGFEYFSTLVDAQRYVEELKNDAEFRYVGHRIWRVELLEEQQHNTAYQADTHKVTV